MNGRLARPIGPMIGQDGKVDIANVMRTHRYVAHCNGVRWAMQNKENVPEENLPPVRFYPREFLEIMTGNRDGILDTLGLPQESRQKIMNWNGVLRKNALSARERDMILATFRARLRDLELSQPVKGDFRTLPVRDPDRDIAMFGPDYITPQKASENCITPVGGFYSGDVFDIEAFMREHRYMLRSKRAAYARAREGKDTGSVHYSKNFLITVLTDKFDIHAKLGISDAEAGELKGFAHVLKDPAVKESELDLLEAAIENALSRDPRSQKRQGEFVEDLRTEEEKTMDMFLSENHRRLQVKNQTGKYPPFSEELCRRIVRPEFVERLKVPYTGMVKLKGGDAAEQTVPGIPDETVAQIESFRPKFESKASESDIVSFGIKVGMALSPMKCGFAAERLNNKDKRPRREVTPDSPMKDIYWELMLELQEMYADRNPKRGAYKGRMNVRFSEGLLRAVFSDAACRAVGLEDVPQISASQPGMEFLRDGFELPAPIRDRTGMKYRTVNAAFAASRTDDLERRREIAGMDWKELSECDEMKSRWDGGEALHARLVLLKYRTNPELAEKLVATGPARITGAGNMLDTATMEARKTLAAERGKDIPETSWFFVWKKEVDSQPEGGLDAWWDSLSSNRKDSVYIALSTTARNAFKAYRDAHPEQFPQRTEGQYPKQDGRTR